MMNRPVGQQLQSRALARPIWLSVVYRRAVEAVIWGMPVVNYDLMYQTMARRKVPSTRSPTGRAFRTGRSRP